MQDLLTWIIANWESVTAVVVGSGTTGFITKKAIDKAQDAKIKAVEKAIEVIKEEIAAMGKTIGQLESDLRMNSQNDQNYREMVTGILADLKKGQEKLESLLMEIVTGKIKVR